MNAVDAWFGRLRAAPGAGAAAATAAKRDLVLHSVTLGHGGKPVIAGVNGCFAAGSLTAIVGPNGGGKTTLLKGLVGLLPVLQGRIEWPCAQQAMGYLAQASEVDRDFPITVHDFVAMGLWQRIGSLRGMGQAQGRRLAQALADVGLQGCEQRWVAELSGGQFQRMRFARLLVQDCPVMLLDEPFVGVDEATTAALLQLLANWHAQGKTVVAVLHDLDMVRRHFPQALALAGQALAWGDTAETLATLAQRNAALPAGLQPSHAPGPRAEQLA